MSNEKLTEALRAFPEDPNPFTYRRCYAKAQEALQAHAAEAAQPLPQMTDAEHAEIQAKYGTAQAAEPVAAIESAEDRHGPYLTHANVVLRVWNGYAPKAGDEIYTHPQPVQDAKDAARYRELRDGDNDLYVAKEGKEGYAPEVFLGPDLDAELDATIAQTELAKESGR